MAEITAAMVKALREKTDQPMMECKKALLEADGDIDKAVDILRKKGLAGLSKRADRDAKEGLVGSYIHHNAKVGAMVELNCETDFVARSEAFKQLVVDLAVQVCATAPLARSSSARSSRANSAPGMRSTSSAQGPRCRATT